MRVFKFGGASTADVNGIKNVAKIIQDNLDDNLIVIVSAMHKTTNALEELLQTIRNEEDPLPVYNKIRDFHFKIIDELFPNRSHPVYSEVEGLFYTLMNAFKLSEEDYDFQYDQMVGTGEMLSSKILSHYLNLINISNRWVDVKTCIATDSSFREGNVNWTLTEQQIKEQANKVFSSSRCFVTQGFLGADDKKRTVTLGREGSDYSGAIFAYCLNAKDMTIWKDVPGFLNADPRYFSNTRKIDYISYSEAIELAYYGATVIHPKTIKPLQNKLIPLIVKSFLEPQASGTVIQNEVPDDKKTTYYICKPNQVLFSIYPKDFSFIAEQNLSYIFFVFAEYNMKINLMQNSAVSFTVCVDNNQQYFDELMEILSNKFEVRYNTNLDLITIRHYKEDDLKQISANLSIFLEQKNRTTAQMVIKGFSS